MGTLGCINDMLQRDKENRELRKMNKDRMKKHYKYLIENGKGVDLSNVSIEKMEEIRKNTVEKEQLEKDSLFKVKMIFAVCALVLFLLGLLCYKLFF